jgi:hypothetical protein
VPWVKGQARGKCGNAEIPERIPIVQRVMLLCNMSRQGIPEVTGAMSNMMVGLHVEVVFRSLIGLTLYLRLQCAASGVVIRFLAV